MSSADSGSYAETMFIGQTISRSRVGAPGEEHSNVGGTFVPKNRMTRFEIFIGIWNTCGEVFETDHAPGTTLSATDTYRWLAGRHFIAHDVDARFGTEISRATEVMGFDLRSNKYVARSFDDKGTFESFDVDLSGRRWRIIGETTRFDGRFDASANQLTGLWELKGKRGGWQPWIALELTRA